MINSKLHYDLLLPLLVRPQLASLMFVLDQLGHRSMMLCSSYQEAALHQKLYPHEPVCLIHPESHGCHFQRDYPLPYVQQPAQRRPGLELLLKLYGMLFTHCIHMLSDSEDLQAPLCNKGTITVFPLTPQHLFCMFRRDEGLSQYSFGLRGKGQGCTLLQTKIFEDHT